MKLDKFDHQILEHLQNEGRITKLELSQRVSLSQTPCHERVKRLENAGFVKGYRAEIDIDKLVESTRFFVSITLERHKQSDFLKFESAIQKIPEILECHALGGGIDYLMTVITRDLRSYQKLIDEMLDRDIGISQYFTYVVTKPVKKYSGYPINHLLTEAQKLKVNVSS